MVLESCWPGGLFGRDGFEQFGRFLGRSRRYGVVALVTYLRQLSKAALTGPLDQPVATEPRPVHNQPPRQWWFSNTVSRGNNFGDRNETVGRRLANGTRRRCCTFGVRGWPPSGGAQRTS